MFNSPAPAAHSIVITKQSMIVNEPSASIIRPHQSSDGSVLIGIFQGCNLVHVITNGTMRGADFCGREENTDEPYARAKQKQH